MLHSSNGEKVTLTFKSLQYLLTIDETFFLLSFYYKMNRNRFKVVSKNEFLVSKETVVLRRWERSKQKFGFIKRVDKG